MLLAATLAFGTGLLQAAWLAWRLHVRHRLIWRGPDYLWMSPASYLLPFLALALASWAVLALVWWKWPAIDGRRILGGILLFAATLSLTLLIPNMHPLAQVLLALGLAWAGSRLVSRAPVRRLAALALGMAALIVVPAAGSEFRDARRHRAAMAALPEAPPGAPSILLIILDTVRAASLSLYGYHRPTTPALERWARQGVVFDYAVSPAPWTLTSHASMFTGHRAAELSADWTRPLDATFPTLAEVLRDQGYFTAGFVANTYYAGWDSGLDRGFVEYHAYQRTLEQVLWSSTLAQTNLAKSLLWSSGWGDVRHALLHPDLTMDPLRLADRKRATRVTDEFLTWQGQHGKRPFFAFLNYFDAHEAYKPPPRYRHLFAARPDKRDLYESCIRYLDDELDRLLTTLQRRGVLDRTIVVIASDHGEYLGEHGLWGHGKGMHLEVLHVPLVLRYPAHVPAGRRVEHVVSLQNLPATLLALAGSPAALPGASLSRAWDSSAALPDSAVASTTYYEDGWLPRARQRWIEAVVTDSTHRIIQSDGRQELYRYRGDPGEVTNLAPR